jgi:hypothetical protein
MFVKRILAILIFMHASVSNAGIHCGANNASCALYMDVKGSLLKRDTNGVVASGIGEVGMLAFVSIVKYGKQGHYAMVRQSLLNDRSTLVVPLKWDGEKWRMDVAYLASISLMASSRELGNRWLMRKIHVKDHKLDKLVWDRLYGQFSESMFSTVQLSRWPDPLFAVSSAKEMHSLGSCYLPSSSKDGDLAIESIACRPVTSILDGEDYEFSGAVGTQAISIMSIHRQGKSLSGCYRYAQYNDDCIEIRGEIQDDGSIILRELASPDGDESGLFRGAINHGKFSGYWRAAGAERNFPFEFLLQGFLD